MAIWVRAQTRTPEKDNPPASRLAAQKIEDSRYQPGNYFAGGDYRLDRGGEVIGLMLFVAVISICAGVAVFTLLLDLHERVSALERIEGAK